MIHASLVPKDIRGDFYEASWHLRSKPSDTLVDIITSGEWVSKETNAAIGWGKSFFAPDNVAVLWVHIPTNCFGKCVEWHPDTWEAESMPVYAHFRDFVIINATGTYFHDRPLLHAIRDDSFKDETAVLQAELCSFYRVKRFEPRLGLPGVHWNRGFVYNELSPALPYEHSGPSPAHFSDGISVAILATIAVLVVVALLLRLVARCRKNVTRTRKENRELDEEEATPLLGVTEYEDTSGAW